MERHNKDVGTKEDLMLYRIRTAKENLRSARILLDAQEYKGANNRAYYAIFKLSMLFMQLMVLLIKDIKMQLQILIKII